MDFQLFHKYNKLVRRNLVEPLTCNHCDTEYVIQIGAFDEPVLRCLPCATIVYPGIRAYEEMKAVVNHYFKENDVRTSQDESKE
jgi:hypothetical protein